MQGWVAYKNFQVVITNIENQTRMTNTGKYIFRRKKLLLSSLGN